MNTLPLRYQSLHVLTKEAVSKGRSVVADHQAYLDKHAETNLWLEAVEANLLALCDVKVRGGLVFVAVCGVLKCRLFIMYSTVFKVIIFLTTDL